MSRSGKMGHEATTVCTSAHQRRAAGSYRWIALSRCLCHETMPDPARFLTRPAPLTDSCQPGLRHPDCTQRHQGLPPRRASVPKTRLITAQDGKATAAWGQSRSVASHLTPNSTCLWQTHFRVDARFSSRGVPRAGLDRARSQHRTDPPSSQAVGRWVAASQALDHLARPTVRAQKNRRDLLIAAASERADQGWVIGYSDEVWWSRLAQPRMHTWAEAGQPLRLQEFDADKSGKHDPDPKALCCYGLLRDDTEQMWLRFVDGRPISHVTIAYLEWVCKRLAAEGKRVLVLIWDNASWHVSREVRDWLRQHNRCVLATRREGKEGIQIIPCFLPTKSPWL